MRTQELEKFLLDAGLINGEWIKHERRFAVLNPATGQVLTEVACLDRSDALQSVDAAHCAFASWAATPEKDRIYILRTWSEAIRANIQVLAKLTTLEQGRPIRESEQEWLGGAEALDWFAAEVSRIHGSVFPLSTSEPMKMVLRQPAGVVAAITPWNFPVLSVLVKCGAAIAAGCTVVLKPSEETPLSALAIGALACESGLPKGVFNIVTTQYPEPIGDVFSTDPRIDILSFTGSSSVGKLLSAKAAGTVKKVALELGGNAPFIIFDDADIDLAVRDLIGARFFNNGQICVGANRVYVHRKIHDAFLDYFSERVRTLKVGDGLLPESDCGPLINSAARERIQGLIDDAIAKGARVVVDGSSDPAFDPLGYFMPPFVLAGVTADMDIRQREIFGPVAAVSAFTDADDIVGEANNTPAGLAAYYYTNDPERQRSLVQQLRAGMVGCNTTNIFDHRMGFGGTKQSGHCREGGIDALSLFFVEKNFFLR